MTVEHEDGQGRFHQIKRWYRKSFIFRRYVFPAWGSFFAFLLPLVYEQGWFDADNRLNIYLGGVFIALVGTWIHRNLELGEEQKAHKDAEYFRAKYEQADLALTERIRIFSYIQHIVKEKSTRFVEACKGLSQNGQLTKDMIFEDITQPRIQINHILAYLGRFFAHGREDRAVKVVLFQPDSEEGHFKFFAYFPKGDRPNPQEQDFRLNRGVVGAAYDKNRMVIIDDVQRDTEGNNPTYLVLPDSTATIPKGSIACYPIRDAERNRTVFVLSIYIDEPNVLQEADRDHLEQIFEPFAQRILLEERLRYLKEECSLGTET